METLNKEWNVISGAQIYFVLCPYWGICWFPSCLVTSTFSFSSLVMHPNTFLSSIQNPIQLRYSLFSPTTKLKHSPSFIPTKKVLLLLLSFFSSFYLWCIPIKEKERRLVLAHLTNFLFPSNNHCLPMKYFLGTKITYCRTSLFFPYWLSFIICTSYVKDLTKKLWPSCVQVLISQYLSLLPS